MSAPGKLFGHSQEAHRHSEQADGATCGNEHGVALLRALGHRRAGSFSLANQRLSDWIAGRHWFRAAHELRARAVGLQNIPPERIGQMKRLAS